MKSEQRIWPLKQLETTQRQEPMSSIKSKRQELIKEWRGHAKRLEDEACSSPNSHKCAQAVFRNKSYGMAAVYTGCANQLEELIK